MAELETVMLGGTTQSNLKKINDNFTALDQEKQSAAQVSAAIDEKIEDLGTGDMAKSVYDDNDDGIVNQADKVTHTLTIKAGAGGTEGTDKYTFDGSATKVLQIAAGDNITVLTAAGVFTIKATDTITKLMLATAQQEITVDTTEKSGSVVLGDAAGKMTATSIPASPSATQEASIPNLAAVKAYVDSLLSSNDAMVFKGVIGTSSPFQSLPTSDYQAGWTWKVASVGTYAGQNCEVGDTIMCINDYVSQFLSSDFIVLQANIDGAVTNSDTDPVTAGEVPIYDGTTGKIIKSSGKTLGTSVPANAVFTDTVYNIVKLTFNSTDGWSSTATDGEFTFTINRSQSYLSGKLPVAVFRKDGSVYNLAMVGIGTTDTEIYIKSYDKFEGYVVMV